MSERKIRFRPTTVGGWCAYVGDVGFGAATPWKASADLTLALGEELPVEWETLPWAVLREAHGVVAGVTHILGASLEAKRAVAMAKWSAAGCTWLCWRCRERAPADAEQMGWRYGSGDTPGESAWDGWLCPHCAADMPGPPTAVETSGGGKKKRRRRRC